jgi:hypothetical protein
MNFGPQRVNNLTTDSFFMNPGGNDVEGVGYYQQPKKSNSARTCTHQLQHVPHCTLQLLWNDVSPESGAANASHSRRKLDPYERQASTGARNTTTSGNRSSWKRDGTNTACTGDCGLEPRVRMPFGATLCALSSFLRCPVWTKGLRRPDPSSKVF